MLNNINKLIVNSIYNNIKNNYKELYLTYLFKTKNQKYKLKFILGACVYFINISCSYKRATLKGYEILFILILIIIPFIKILLN